MRTEQAPVLGVLGRVPYHMARIASLGCLHMCLPYMTDWCMLLSCLTHARGACCLLLTLL